MPNAPTFCRWRKALWRSPLSRASAISDALEHHKTKCQAYCISWSDGNSNSLANPIITRLKAGHGTHCVAHFRVRNKIILKVVACLLREPERIPGTTSARQARRRSPCVSTLFARVLSTFTRRSLFNFCDTLVRTSIIPGSEMFGPHGRILSSA